MKITSKLTFAATAAVLTLLAGCGKKDADTTAEGGSAYQLYIPEPTSAHLAQIGEIAQLYPSAQSTESGLHYIVEKEGSGESPTVGQKVVAHYHGTLLSGKVFDSSVKRGSPYRFSVGKGRVIRGWDEAFLSMKKGEKRKLILPAEIAYGLRGSPPVIPANSILIFDVELIDFK